MEVTVLFFGMCAEVTKTPRLELKTNSVSISELEKEVTDLFPKLKVMSYKIALNENIVGSEIQLRSESRIAFLPPFAGG